MEHGTANEKRNPKTRIHDIHTVYATISGTISSTYTVLVVGPLLPPKLNATLATTRQRQRSGRNGSIGLPAPLRMPTPASSG